MDPSAGRIAGLCLTEAFSLAAGGRVQGVVAAPINKEAFRLGGFDYVDEIAFLMELTGSSEPRLFGILEHVWTTCVTLHTAFRDIPQAITKERVFGVIKSMHDALAKVGAGRAAIAVAALNPHNGEGGLLGREELDEIGPAVHDARDVGIDVSGPYPADTVFPRAIASKIRGVVCMYHDQANIARKLHGYQDSATAFIGLPVPYATTAHGTAFDIVGTGKADPSSLVAALRFVLGQCNAEKGDAQRARERGVPYDRQTGRQRRVGCPRTVFPGGIARLGLADRRGRLGRHPGREGLPLVSGGGGPNEHAGRSLGQRYCPERGRWVRAGYTRRFCQT